ncbi:ATP-binding protein [Aliifodinibius salicampi]|uniref:ATP-binding protein n=1 Tax=Fodinibius salicampi TaxID=1920655 RepID=A0ABT3PVS0_9BACT|nr:ATP-binding protein [Fodinibius salicampi]MCW9711955.1 ATP-binding protein [Fodinibius salicampi]
MTLSIIGIKLGEAHQLSRDKYLPRVMGDLAAFLILSFLVVERGWSYWYFPFLVLSFLIYPHLVLLASKMAPGTKKIEKGAMMIEAFIMCLWIPFANFFLWGTFALHLATVIQNGLVGGYRQIVVSHVPLLSGVLCGGLLTGFVVELDGPFYLELFTVLFLLAYMVDLGGTFYKQNIRIKENSLNLDKQNLKLDNTIEELYSTKEELSEKAHKAGMADLATGILHNLGNVLNSVNISAGQIAETLKSSKISSLKKANRLLDEHQDNFKKFIIEDPRGKQLMNYYLKLEEPMVEEYREIQKHSNRLDDKVQLMTEIIEAQQKYVATGAETEETSLKELIDSALLFQEGFIDQHNLKIEKDLGLTDPVAVQRTKLLYMLVNIFEKAMEAVSELPSQDRKIVIKTWQDEKNVYLSIIVNGIEIQKNDIDKIFSQDFSTKESSHGFGLDSSANYLSEIGCEIEVKRGEKEIGATIILTFPRIGEKQTP